MITSGEGKYKVFLEKKVIGNDLIFILGGGEKSHIGGYVFCSPGKDPQIIKISGHYDDVVLKPIAEAACKKYKTKVIAVGGVHIDNATKDEIEILVNNCHDLLRYI